MSKIYGYARVSTREQNEDRQMIALREAGVSESDIFLDKQSGKDFNRPAYKRLIKKLKPGDVLITKSIDRLGRNYKEIIEEWRRITKEKETAILILDMPLLDTRKKDNDLISTVISDIVLQLLSYVAHIERDFIKTRQAEGIRAAKLRGVKFGREPRVKPENFENVLNRWRSGEISGREGARLLSIAPSTFFRWASQCP